MAAPVKCSTRARRLAAGLSVCTVAALTGCGGTTQVAAVAGPHTIVWGAGGSVEFPIYEEAGSFLRDQGITLNYQQIGPAQAMSDFRAGKLAFVAADGSPPSPLALAGLGRSTSTAVSLPVALWGTAVIYNLPSVHVRLRLDGRTLADMYRGKVTMWNDRQIARQNPGVRLPALAISVVWRSDPNTATAMLTGYMAAHSARWRRTVGSGRSVRWPGGTPDVDDAGMLQTVASNPGAIGYTEEPVVLQNDLHAASLRTASGAYVAPTFRATTAGAYPLIANAYVLTYRDLCDAGLSASKTAAAQRFLAYLLGPGQAVVKRLSFAPLPRRMRVLALTEVHRLQCGSQPIA